MKKIQKNEAKEKISSFFADIQSKTPKQIKKIRRLAMKHNIALKAKRKAFCKKCLSPYKKPKIRINKGMKKTTCENCGYINRWKIR